LELTRKYTDYSLIVQQHCKLIARKPWTCCKIIVYLLQEHDVLLTMTSHTPYYVFADALLCACVLIVRRILSHRIWNFGKKHHSSSFLYNYHYYR